MQPFIEVEIVNTTEKNKSKKDLLSLMKRRFEKTHKISAKWCGDPKNPKFRLDYPSKEIFLQAYNYGLEFFDKVRELIDNQDPLPVEKFITHPSSNNDQQILKNYITIRYRTNFKDPMRKNYEFTGPMANILKTNFFIEEVKDGFLIFYKYKEDFEVAQIDRMDPDEIQNWFENHNIDVNQSSIRKLLDFLKNEKEKS